MEVKKTDGVKGIEGLIEILPGCPSLFSYNNSMWKCHYCLHMESSSAEVKGWLIVIVIYLQN